MSLLEEHEKVLKAVEELLKPVAEGNPDDAANICSGAYMLIAEFREKVEAHYMEQMRCKHCGGFH